jgi:hypothetical protein
LAATAATTGLQTQEAIQKLAAEPLGREGRAQNERSNQSFAVHSSNNSFTLNWGSSLPALRKTVGSSFTRT